MFSAEVERTANQIRDAIADLPMVVALAIGGSTGAGLADQDSDLDIYVYWSAPLAEPAERAARLLRCADPGSLRVEVRSWGLEDWLWAGGRKVEVVYLNVSDLQAEVERAYGPGLDSESYTTALLYIVAGGEPLYDRTGAIAALRARLRATFPEATRRVLIERRTPLLSVLIEEIRRAQQRDDLLYAANRRCALQELYFNLLFTLNRRLHPGGKRLLLHAERCPIRPPDLGARWQALSRLAPDDAAVVSQLQPLVAELLALIEQHGGVAMRSSVW